MGYVEDCEKILKDLYYSILIFFQRLITSSNGSYIELAKKILSKFDNFPVYINGKNLGAPQKSGINTIVIDDNNLRGTYIAITSINPIQFGGNITTVHKTVSSLRKTSFDNYIEIDDFSLGNILTHLSQIRQIENDKALKDNVETILNRLRIHTEAFSKGGCEEKLINRYIDVLDDYVKRKYGSSGLTQQQRNAIEIWAKTRNVYVEGVPGASKTFIGVASLVLSALIDSTIIRPNIKFYNYLVVALTYKALEEFIKKAIEIFTDNNVINFLSNFMEKIGCEAKQNKGLKTITIYLNVSQHQIEREGGCEKYLEKFKEKVESNVKLNWLDKDACDVIKGNNTGDFCKCLKISIPISGKEDDDEIAFHLFVMQYLLQKKSINLYCITALHIEEASQIPLYMLILLLNKLQNSCFFKNIVSKNENANSNKCPKNIWRFSFSGDALQLGPIYQKPDGDLNLFLINYYYNLFSFFLTSKQNRIYLNESFRVCSELLECVEDFYKDINEEGISAQRKECCEHINIRKDLSDLTEFQKEVCEILNGIKNKACILRVEYSCDENTKFKRENILELQILCSLLRILNYKDIAILTPFRNQEELIKTCFGDKHIIGTVDKLQGDEKDIVFFLTTANDKEYIRNVKGFIFNPNRLNVAITRTKRLFVLIHSTELKEVAFTDFDINFNEKLNDVLAELTNSNSFIKQMYESNPEEVERSISKFIKMLDVNEGMYIFQKAIKKSNRHVGSVKLNNCSISFYTN